MPRRGLHEPKRGEISFEGIRDLEPFFAAAMKAGLYLIARPGQDNLTLNALHTDLCSVRTVHVSQARSQACVHLLKQSVATRRPPQEASLAGPPLFRACGEPPTRTMQQHGRATSQLSVPRLQNIKLPMAGLSSSCKYVTSYTDQDTQLTKASTVRE